MRYWTSADYHLGHGNIIKYSNRPFSTPFEMNEAIIAKHNERVKPEDTFFFLGDFCFKHSLEDDAIAGGRPTKADEWLSRLNGHKIMIRGNHDNNNSLKTIIDSMHITYAQQRINLTHKPEHANPAFPINLVGHVHKAWKIRYFKEHYEIIRKTVMDNADLPSDRQDLREFLVRNKDYKDSDSVLLNVGVDVQNYMPISLDEALGQIVKFRRGINERDK